MRKVFARLQKVFYGNVLGSRPRRMRLCETLALGEKRFLAVVRVDQQQFLVGGAANSVALLTELPSPLAAKNEMLNSNLSFASQGIRRDMD